MFLTFPPEVDHPQENGDIPTEGIPSAKKAKNHFKVVCFTSTDIE